MRIMRELVSVYVSPVPGLEGVEEQIKVTCKIVFKSEERRKLENTDFSNLTGHIRYEFFDGGTVLELFNSETIKSNLSEHEKNKKRDELRTELIVKALEIQNYLAKNYDFKIEENIDN